MANNSDQDSPDLTKESTPLPDNQASLGAWLQSHRMRRNYDVEDIVRLTKYSKRALVSLENNEWEELPTGFSLRAMVRRYAKVLDLDESEAVEKLERQCSDAAYQQANSSHMVSSLDHNLTPVKTREGRGGGGRWFSSLLIIIILLVVLVVLAIVLGIYDPTGTPLEFIKDYLPEPK